MWPNRIQKQVKKKKSKYLNYIHKIRIGLLTFLNSSVIPSVVILEVGTNFRVRVPSRTLSTGAHSFPSSSHMRVVIEHGCSVESGVIQRALECDFSATEV